MRRGVVAVLGLSVLIVAACTGGGASLAPSPTAAPTPSRTPAPVELTIFAAASLKGVLADVKTAYEAANPDVTLTVATDSSAALATQIEQGAPADIFLSADTKNPRRLADASLVDTPVAFAGNKLVVIVPADNPAGIKSPADLAKAGVKIIAAGDEVPITRYANQLVDNLAREPGYPAHFAASYLANVVSKEDNVKAVVAKLELGEGDAAIVYVTDAKASVKVASVGVPDSSQVIATYTGATVKASKNADAATAFLTWLAGPDGQAILAGYGVLPSPS